jgi:endonuclease/exonuclease/phosphatase family metal-dependent hydrolase
MPYYYPLKKQPEDVRRRTAQGILKLREQLRQEVPPRTVSETLLLATWNIREFDSEKYGRRCEECFYYMAEIIDRFDLVAIQEVREDLWALDKLQDLLGGWWRYIVTDLTEGTSGNGERMAFLYDGRKVSFGGLAGEIVLPDSRKERVLQFARTPFICGFRSGWTKFNLCTVHIYYGEAKADDPRRVKEIQDLAELLAKRARTPKAQPAGPDEPAGRARDSENLILLGDFNIFSRDDVTMKALTDAGFTVPEELQPLPEATSTAASTTTRSPTWPGPSASEPPARRGSSTTTSRCSPRTTTRPTRASCPRSTRPRRIPSAITTTGGPSRCRTTWCSGWSCARTSRRSTSKTFRRRISREE